MYFLLVLVHVVVIMWLSSEEVDFFLVATESRVSSV
jgi:hypothetical protein